MTSKEYPAFNTRALAVPFSCRRSNLDVSENTLRGDHRLEGQPEGRAVLWS